MSRTGLRIAEVVRDLPRFIPRAAAGGVGGGRPARLSRAAMASLMRLVELMIAPAVLALTSPLMIIVAIVIRLDSPGPALFRQVRVGRNGQLFTFYKFRTLYSTAREMFPELYSYRYTPEQIEDLQFKREEDPRITPAGRWLRKSTFDELPNFWNLLKGDVALVGPRPEIPEMLPYYAPEQMIKFSVKPGITGLAQTRGRGRLKFRETVDFDLEYVRNKSFRLDWEIVLTTIKLLVRADGAF